MSSAAFWFAAPWALAGLAGLPVLLVVYLLRRRGRELVVPALFLWRTPAAPAAGPRIAPRRLPPAFWLELAALALLAVGAAGPWLPGAGTRPLLVVLDPSYSMGAGGARSPRRQAEGALVDALRRRPELRVTLMLAADPPSVLGEDLSPSAVPGALRGWTVEGAGAKLEAALRLAAERRAADVLVLTDGPPPADLPPRVAWWAFGSPLPNLAIVAAGRSEGQQADGAAPGGAAVDVVTVEVANLSGVTAVVPVTVRVGSGEATSPHPLGAGESWRLRLAVDASAPVRARVAAGDALALDDGITLPARAAPPLGVTVSGLAAPLARSVREAIAASGLARLDPPAASPAVVALEVLAAPAAGSLPPAAPGRWRVLVHREPVVVPYLGPFALDGRHPLVAGLAAEGVVWAAGAAAANPPGRPVVAAGPVVLLADEERPGGAHDLHLRLREDLSTVEREPLWPVLWWNLLAWRRAALPGPAEPVARLGEVVSVRLPAGAATARVRGEGWEQRLEAMDGVVRFLPPRPGDYTLEAGERRFALAVAALSRQESDLRGRVTMRRGALAPSEVTPGRQSFAWVAAIAALALLVVEGALLGSGAARTGQGARR